MGGDLTPEQKAAIERRDRAREREVEAYRAVAIRLEIHRMEEQIFGERMNRKQRRKWRAQTGKRK